jgi:hypothetical protein
VITDRETGRSRGFGFVEMDGDADKAINQLNGRDMAAARCASTSQDRRRGGGGGGGGGRRTRSRRRWTRPLVAQHRFAR